MGWAGCDQVLCGTEELHYSLDGFKRSVELLAAVWYNVAKMFGRDDVAKAIEEAVKRYVEPNARDHYQICIDNCRLDGSPGCSDECKQLYNDLIEAYTNEILGRKPPADDEEEARDDQD